MHSSKSWVIGGLSLLLSLLLVYSMRTRLLNTLTFFPSRDIFATPAELGLSFEDLSIETADGERLHGWWVPSPSSEVRGAVLIFHGNAGNIASRLIFLDRLTRLGFSVLLFDYRGYGGSTGSPSEEGTYLDARAARKALPAVDGPVIYLGVSLGGAVAAALAVESPPDGLILQSTFTSVRDMARIHYPILPASFVPDAYKTAQRVPQIRAPTLFIHGESDRVVPVLHAVELHRLAPGLKRLERVPGADHNDVLDAMGPRYGKLIVEWVESWRPSSHAGGESVEDSPRDPTR